MIPITAQVEFSGVLMSIEKAARRIHDEWITHSIPVPSVGYLARIIQKELSGHEEGPDDKGLEPGQVKCPECEGRGMLHTLAGSEVMNDSRAPSGDWNVDIL